MTITAIGTRTKTASASQRRTPRLERNTYPAARLTTATATATASMTRLASSAKTTRITIARPTSTKLRRASQRDLRVLRGSGPAVSAGTVRTSSTGPRPWRAALSPRSSLPPDHRCRNVSLPPFLATADYRHPHTGDLLPRHQPGPRNCADDGTGGPGPGPPGLVSAGAARPPGLRR